MQTAPCHATSTKQFLSDHRADLIAAAHRALRNEFIAAWGKGGATSVRTPGFARDNGQQTLIDVFSDDMSGAGSDAQWNELIAIVQGASAGEDVRLRAAAFIAGAAKRHADYHASDAVDGDQE